MGYVGCMWLSSSPLRVLGGTRSRASRALAGLAGRRALRDRDMRMQSAPSWVMWGAGRQGLLDRVGPGGL